MKNRRIIIAAIGLSIILAFSATGFKSGDAGIPPEIPDGAEAIIEDASGQIYTAGSDNLSNGLLERPITIANPSAYQPDEDIVGSFFLRTESWNFVRIQLSGAGPSGMAGKAYGVELDLNKDGRGDVLMAVDSITSSWDHSNIMVWLDANQDVGGKTGGHPDTNPSNGYDLVLSDHGKSSDPDLVWARMDKQYPNMIDFAFKPALLQGSREFTWRVWAWKNLASIQPGKFDYNDHFLSGEAGSPDPKATDYPIKGLAEVDNTCLAAIGFNPTGNEPGICIKSSKPAGAGSSTPAAGTTPSVSVLPPIKVITVTLPVVSGGGLKIGTITPTPTTGKKISKVTPELTISTKTKDVVFSTQPKIVIAPAKTQKTNEIKTVIVRNTPIPTKQKAVLK